MTCREFIAFLDEYLSASLSARQRARFERHLAGCQDCTAYLMSYQHTIALGKVAFPQLDDPVPGDVPEKLIRAILTVRAARP